MARTGLLSLICQLYQSKGRQSLLQNAFLVECLSQLFEGEAAFDIFEETEVVWLTIHEPLDLQLLHLRRSRQ